MQIAEDAGEHDLPPALRNAGRILAALGGVTVGAAMLVIGGLFALLTGCVGYAGATGACGSLAPLVGPLELVAVYGGAAASTGGGIATAVTAKARWIAIGLAITIVLVVLLSVLVGLQEGRLG